MIFEILYESMKNGELILLNGGYCRWHLRKDRQITIYEILSSKLGMGSLILEILKTKGGTSIFARCPVNLSANEWYKKQGFILEGEEITSSGRKLLLWRLKNEN